MSEKRTGNKSTINRASGRHHTVTSRFALKGTVTTMRSITATRLTVPFLSAPPTDIPLGSTMSHPMVEAQTSVAAGRQHILPYTKGEPLNVTPTCCKEGGHQHVRTLQHNTSPESPSMDG
ncbi:PREDICTED: uncharacterized protein LOC108365588 [Rhagoletis zephyria]|uniref:uncharacterized protein LOC108365588 n=1 Tax=Rhagoletis zephyria TaxID=28612 RepID=UPI0008112DDA|nr:PREDICTED: uncharacterized protein LOC108365588 [Rhagoletis zephyria]